VANFDTVTNKQTSTWVDYGIPIEHAVQYRADGYPINLDRWIRSGTTESRVSAIANIGKGGANVRSGLYVCRFDGQGEVLVEKDGVIIQNNGSSMLVNVTSSNGIRIRIMRTNSSDPVCNITFFPVELASKSFPEYPFHPDFIASLQGASLLRFSGWLRVDSNDYNPMNQPRNWTLRTYITDQTQNCLAGVALEHMIALSNILNASPWFGLPKAANLQDNYHIQFANMVTKLLNPDQKIYIEYRDEGKFSLLICFPLV
jgi:hypothetical protein